MTILTTPDQIATARLLTLRAGLKLEMRGLRISKGRSCYAILKSEGFKGSRESILNQLAALLS